MPSPAWIRNIGLFFTLTSQLAIGQYVNDDWDTDFLFECPAGEHIYYATSVFDDTTYSRKWGFDCRHGFVSEDCYWTDWLNSYCDNNYQTTGTGDSGIEYDGTVVDGFDAKCDGSAIVTGFEGVHMVTGSDADACNGKTRDYIWKMKCCEPNTMVSNQATNLGGTGRTAWYTDFIGEYQGLIDYALAEDNYVIYGLIGKTHTYSDGDRYFRFRVNERSKCWAQNMTITNSPPTTPTNMKVVGLASGLTCNPDANINLEQGELKEVTQSTEVTTEETHDFTFSRTISVETEATIAGSTVGFGFSASIGAGFGVGTSTTVGTSETYATSAMFTVDYSGPMAVLVRGIQEEYIVESDTAGATYGVQCENGDSFMHDGTVTVSTNSYGRTHFNALSFKFNEMETCEEHKDAMEACMEGISAAFALDDSDENDESYYQSQFVNCFYDGGERFDDLGYGNFYF